MQIEPNKSHAFDNWSHQTPDKYIIAEIHTINRWKIYLKIPITEIHLHEVYCIPVIIKLRSLLSPHIPHGIHMDSTHSIWNMFWLGSQPFQPFHPTWNLCGMSWIPCGFHHSIWNLHGKRKLPKKEICRAFSLDLHMK